MGLVAESQGVAVRENTFGSSTCTSCSWCKRTGCGLSTWLPCHFCKQEMAWFKYLDIIPFM